MLLRQSRCQEAAKSYTMLFALQLGLSQPESTRFAASQNAADRPRGPAVGPSMVRSAGPPPSAPPGQVDLAIEVVNVWPELGAQR
jgi:hypothetical protein